MIEAILFSTFLGKAAWLWIVFVSIVVVLLALDLGFFHRDQHEIDIKESLIMSGCYITLGLLFGAWVWWEFGDESGMTYLTGFLIEKSLSLDNIFVISLIFTALNIPRKYQHRVLFWGIIGVIVLRGIMIGLGAVIVSQFSWVLYLFAMFLVLTGYKLLILSSGIQSWFGAQRNGRTIAAGIWLALCAVMVYAANIGLSRTVDETWIHVLVYACTAGLAFLGVQLTYWGEAHEEKEPDIQNNPAIKFLNKNMNVTHQMHGQNFFVRLAHPKNGKLVWFATPLFIALIAIEFVDLVFAVDSVPAIFTITTDPYIIYTSNIFAILGLRALYFALAAILHKFAYLKYALALVLIFIGSKIFIADTLGWAKFPPAISLGVTVALLAGGVIVSLMKTKKLNTQP